MEENFLSCYWILPLEWYPYIYSCEAAEKLFKRALFLHYSILQSSSYYLIDIVTFNLLVFSAFSRFLSYVLRSFLLSENKKCNLFQAHIITPFSASLSCIITIIDVRNLWSGGKLNTNTNSPVCRSMSWKNYFLRTEIKWSGEQIRRPANYNVLVIWQTK